ncbi:Putative ribonuclease H protein At1g65750 [Linum perenne]
MEVLVKTVLSALPVYTMSCFLLPKENIKRLTSLIRDFWWGQHDGRRKITWVAWSRLCTPKSKGGLGFRDLHHFNLALLAKQGWKIISEPNSLLARFYKGKYFHDSTFFLAEPRSNPSWGWSSIIASRGLLLQGLRCQVGTGLQILAFQDNWLPTTPARPPERVPSSEPWSPFTPVSMFINHGFWDIQLLTRIFSPVDVAIISAIPLPIEPIPDQFIWQFSDSGAYTVHSGYDVVHHGLVETPEVGPTSPMDVGAWNKLWTFPIPPKLHFFVWKCVLGVLPTRTALQARIPDFPRSCPVCESPAESVSHLLLFCPVTVRFGASLNLPLHLVSSSNFCIVWRKLLRLEPSLGRKFIFFWWRLWKSRNTVIFLSKQFSIPALKAQMENHMAKSEIELDQEDMGRGVPRRQQINVPTRWRPPPTGRLKINVDGAVRRGQGGGIGLILRDEAGNVLFAAGRSLPHFSDPFTIEALAFREALRWCLNRSVVNVDIEGDAAMVSSHILDKKRLHPRAGAIIQECKLLLLRQPTIRCFAVRREANTAAHNLARHSLTMLPLRTGLLNLTHFACSHLN